MDKIPSISVILTSFNHEKYLKDSINSVLSQTFDDFELIIVDDCSTDNSWKIIQSYSDPRIRTYRSPENQRTANLYHGIGMANGKYLALHHSDDCWHKDKLQKQWEWLENHPEDIAVFTHVQTINEEGLPCDDPMMHLFEQPNRSSTHWLRYFFENGNCLCHPSVMMPTDYAKELYVHYGLTAINDFRNWVRTCTRHSIHIIKEKLCYFRIRDGLSNDSAPTAAQKAKHGMELPFILECYETIQNKETFLKIFPEARQYISGGEIHLGYAFSMICLRKNEPPHVLYALHKLIRLLDSEKDREDLKRLYSFTTKNMADLGRQFDPFFIAGRNAYMRQAMIIETVPVLKKFFQSV